MSKVDLSKYKSLRKTKKALNEIKNKELREEIVWYYREKTRKNVWKITRKNLADAVFSEYCRLYHSDSNWMVECITSWIKMPRYKSQCWHFISRAVLKYRYDILNCYPQSYQDNVILSWNYKVYTIKMIEMLWLEKVKEMMEDKETVDYNQKRYEDHILERYAFIKPKKNSIISKDVDDFVTELSRMEF